MNVTNRDNLNKKRSNINNNKISEYTTEYVWIRIVLIFLLHVGLMFGCYYLLFENCWKFVLFYCLPLGIASSIGITAGAHRLWTHRSYKAKWPLRVILMILQTTAYQNSILEWARDHRAHHKFTDTDADPHNSRRGFFFCHMGWLMVRKHPEVKIKGKSIDMSDVKSDPIVQFQEKYFYILMPFLAFIIPGLVPYYFLNQTFVHSIVLGAISRYIVTLHLTWTINSVAHLWGVRPYDKNIRPCDNWAIIGVTIGEGYHNYHHIFPWDYKCSEFGTFFNLTKLFLDAFAKIGWAYDMKTASEDVIKNRVLRTGDGTHKYFKENKNTAEASESKLDIDDHRLNDTNNENLKIR